MQFKIQQSKTALNHAVNADARNSPAFDCDPGLPFCQGWKYNVGSHVKSEFQQLKGWTVHLLHNGTLVWSLTLEQVSSFSTEPTNCICSTSLAIVIISLHTRLVINFIVPSLGHSCWPTVAVLYCDVAQGCTGWVTHVHIVNRHSHEPSGA